MSAAGSGDGLPAQGAFRRRQPHAGMADLVPYGLRLEKRQRLQRQKAGHEEGIQQDPARKLPIQPFFQRQRRNGHRNAANVSSQQAGR